MLTKELGKIESAKFGIADERFGLSLTFSGPGWGVGFFEGSWGISVECSSYCKWSETDRDKKFAEVCRYLNGILTQAKKRHVGELAGVPVEVTFERGTLVSWRVLTEVL